MRFNKKQVAVACDKAVSKQVRINRLYGSSFCALLFVAGVYVEHYFDLLNRLASLNSVIGL